MPSRLTLLPTSGRPDDTRLVSEPPLQYFSLPCLHTGGYMPDAISLNFLNREIVHPPSDDERAANQPELARIASEAAAAARAAEVLAAQRQLDLAVQATARQSQLDGWEARRAAISRANPGASGSGGGAAGQDGDDVEPDQLLE